MKTVKTTYECDRCHKEIDKRVFMPNFTFKKAMSALVYEQVKFGYLPSEMVPLPEEEVMVVEGICGYLSKGLKNIHLCSKCTKEFKKFMRGKENG